MYYLRGRWVNNLTGKEVIAIPAKFGKNTTHMLYPEEEEIVKEVTEMLSKETGRKSKSEAVRLLIREGAKAMKEKQNVPNV